MNETPSATAIIAPIWRRKWLILLVGIVVSGAAYLYYKHERPVYRAETRLLLGAGREELPAGEKGTSGKAAAATQAAQPEIINSVVAPLVKAQLKKEHGRVAKLAAKAKLKAKVAEKSQFVTLTTEAHSPKAAVLLANTVAATYIKREHRQYERAILTQLVIEHHQLERLETPTSPAAIKKASSTSGSAGAAIREVQISSRINQLEAELGVQQVQQIGPASVPKTLLVSPHPRRNAEFGFVIGILLAAIAAFILGRLDRRLRTLADVGAIFPTQILAVLPEVKRPLLTRDERRQPSRLLIEPLRSLRTTLSLNRSANGASAAAHHSILFLSPDGGDGRTTVIAGLALVQQEAGERTAVLDADMRRPGQALALGVNDHAGLVEVLTGVLTLDEALQTVGSPRVQPQPVGAEAPAGLLPVDTGSLAVLPARAEPSLNPPALLGSKRFAELLATLTAEFDNVLLDTPSPLEFSDAVPILARADAVVLVVRLGYTRERSAERLQELLARGTSATVLGVVVNGAQERSIRQYGLGADRHRQAWPARLLNR